MKNTRYFSAYAQLALDPSPHVRECSCFCLGQFAEHCQPEILDHSEEVLPIVFRLLDDATDNVKVKQCNSEESQKLTAKQLYCLWSLTYSVQS